MNEPMDGALEPFIPNPDIRERHEVLVRAPATLVFDTAAAFDMQSIRLVRAIFRMRERMLGTRTTDRRSRGFLAELQSLGWACLEKREGELFVGGAACQPWLADVVFEPIPSERFSAYAEPDHVKIAWTLEAQAIAPERTRLASETRAVATDAAAHARFKAYWRWARFGIIAIRWLLLPGIRRQAEARWRAVR
jgi:hypothetical protein